MVGSWPKNLPLTKAVASTSYEELRQYGTRRFKKLSLPNGGRKVVVGLSLVRTFFEILSPVKVLLFQVVYLFSIFYIIVTLAGWVRVGGVAA